jgi:hypothetical protein
MDETYSRRSAERSAEEIAWDREFNDTRDSITATVSDLAKLAVRVPVALIRMPSVMLPPDTRRHARAAARESFLAVRSLMSAIGDRIEDMLAEPAVDTRGTVGGPPGTWGTARQTVYSTTTATTTTPSAPATTTSTSTRVKRIEVTEESQAPLSDDEQPPQDRGLRADIEY